MRHPMAGCCICSWLLAWKFKALPMISGIFTGFAINDGLQIAVNAPEVVIARETLGLEILG
jgi:hypothetical protein